MNPVANSASPTGMTTTAGPGYTIMASPAASIVKPITTTTNRLACPKVLSAKCLTIFSSRQATPLSALRPTSNRAP